MTMNRAEYMSLHALLDWYIHPWNMSYVVPLPRVAYTLHCSQHDLYIQVWYTHVSFELFSFSDAEEEEEETKNHYSLWEVATDVSS
jgi:hypothetical protein